MGLPMDEQEISTPTTGARSRRGSDADSYDEVFDEFLRNWLTVINAPTSIVARDVYRLFKRHVMDNGYDKPGQMAELLKEIRRYAGTTRASRLVPVRTRSSAFFSLAFRSLTSQL